MAQAAVLPPRLTEKRIMKKEEQQVSSNRSRRTVRGTPVYSYKEIYFRFP
jgi:hypothetical protein